MISRKEFNYSTFVEVFTYLCLLFLVEVKWVSHVAASKTWFLVEVTCVSQFATSKTWFLVTRSWVSQLAACKLCVMRTNLLSIYYWAVSCYRSYSWMSQQQAWIHTHAATSGLCWRKRRKGVWFFWQHTLWMKLTY